MTTITNGYNAYSASRYTMTAAQREAREAEAARNSTESQNSEQTRSTPVDPAILNKGLAELIAEIPRDGYGKLSFEDLKEHRKNMETAFHDEVEKDLKALGVDTEKDFPLSLNHDGSVTTSGHPDADKINKYFQAHPERREQLKKVIDLGKIANIAENKLSPEMLRTKIQAQSMSWWAQDNGFASDVMNAQGYMFGKASELMQTLNLRV